METVEENVLSATILLYFLRVVGGGLNKNQWRHGTWTFLGGGNTVKSTEG